MSKRIEDYALIGDCETAALVARDGSIDWLCFPRFDSGACFAALLGGPEQGRWLISPVGEARCVSRRYRGDTLVLETDLEADGGVVRLIDFMPLRSNFPDLVRIVEGVRGQVRVQTELIVRFDYGSLIPWVRSDDGGITAIAGPDMLRLSSPVETRGEDLKTVAEFDVSEGQRLAFDITWYPSHQPRPREIDPFDALKGTEDLWNDWSGRCSYEGGWRAEVLRSLITLKALTYSPTGGIVAAPTTSLPEKLGGVRNWDYRFCWLRDATFTLYALLNAGYEREAADWREWLLRAAAGQPDQLHIMYGIAGERRLPELELPWLPGYERSSPVRIGNGAHNQLQLDVFGEVLDAMHQSWRAGVRPDPAAWSLERSLLDHLESAWHEPDDGIWEVRGRRRHFTHSKMMAWVAMDRAVKAVERFGLEGPAAKWRRLRAEIHDEVCSHGFDGELGSFVQSYGSKQLDASLLMIPLVGFLAPDDPRVRGTVAAIERHLVTDGFAMRYQSDPEIDGMPHGEGAFLLCTFWLADNLELQGRHEDAKRIFERLLAVRSDVGLLAESYDVADRRLLGNYPQAFSHVGLVNTAHNLSRRGGPAEHRPRS